MEQIQIFNTPIDNVSFEEMSEILENSLRENHLTKIYTPNTEIVMRAKDDEEISDLINRGDYRVADGIGLIYGAKIHRSPLKERVTGVDLSYRLLEIAQREGYGVFFLGGRPGVAKRAMVQVQEKYPGIRIVGEHHGYFKEDEEVIEEINKSGTDILFVGLGFPKQEAWIDKNGQALESVKIAIGNGGVLDLLAGDAKRAPEILIKLGLEWLHRLIMQPSRFKRQLAIPKFLYQVIKDRNAVKVIERDE